MQKLSYTLSLNRTVLEQELFPLEIVKNYLRVEGDEDDDLINIFISSAIDEAESRTHREIKYSRFEWKILNFNSEIELPITPCISCVSISLDNIEIDNVKYRFISGNESPLYGKIIPLEEMNEGEYTIILLGGYTSDTIPDSIKKWIFSRISDYYEYRESVLSGISVVELSRKYVNALLDKYTILDI